MIPHIKQLILKGFSENPIFLKLHNFLLANRDNKITDNIKSEILALEQLSTEQVKSLNEKEFKKILRHAYTTTPYYKTLFDKYNIDTTNWSNYREIPVLNKSIIKDHGKDLISSNYDIKFLGKRFTGGSTGQPMEFYTEKRGGLRDNAHHWYLYHLIGYKPGEIILGFYGRQVSEKYTDKNIYWNKTIGDNVFGDYVFSLFYLNDQTAPYYVEKIIALRPTILRGYPSFLNSLATYILSNNIRLVLNIKGVVLTAELCSDIQRENIEQAFGCKVYLEYGHKEISVFCHSTATSYKYFSAPLYCYLEVLNDDGTETPIGQVGRIVTTGFCNYGMPFIRYDTADLGRVSSRNGGVVTLSEIMGRSQDYLIDKNNEKINLIATIYRYKIDAFKRIKRWQIKQNVPGKIEILIIPDTQFSKDDELEILNTVELFKKFIVEFHYVDDIPKSKIGKHLAVLQNI
ncbi:phenylacetate--CoA ligase family protein [Arenibacter latericius]|uniref:phenylacetate--CoA ligase family protein n=1 Tax=Arenibacter latericius TaxID=86104 RepID=UPI00040FAC30|nr:phenylacetate--CoA ligase family protein [Arenibacter latericius]